MKEKIKSLLADIAYRLHQIRGSKNEIKVLSIDETLDELLHSGKSLVRFGDGEIIMIRGKSLYFQPHTQELSRRLAEILRYEEDGFMVAIPDIFAGLYQYRPSGQHFWKDHLLFFRSVYQEYCSPEKCYGNAYVSRCYYNYADKTKCAGWFLKFRQLWEGKKIVVVEGAGTHNGVGNDLLSNAAEVSRIICPAQNAGEKLPDIFEACLRLPDESLYLLSLGPAAKLLAEDLFHAGRRVLDIGNLDMEYEWFLKNAKRKEPLEKHSIIGVEANEKAGHMVYLKQIKVWIK